MALKRVFADLICHARRKHARTRRAYFESSRCIVCCLPSMRLWSVLWCGGCLLLRVFTVHVHTCCESVLRTVRGFLELLYSTASLRPHLNRSVLRTVRGFLELLYSTASLRPHLYRAPEAQRASHARKAAAAVRVGMLRHWSLVHRQYWAATGNAQHNNNNKRWQAGKLDGHTHSLLTLLTSCSFASSLGFS
jgi:hypothetical protein